MILRTNPETCYFYDNITHKKSAIFIDSPKLSLYYIDSDGEENIYNNVYMDSRTNIIIAKDERGTTNIVDDGHRNSMVRSGYLVMNGHDREKIEDRDLGNQIHQELILDTSFAILNLRHLKDKFEFVCKFNDKFIVEDSGYKFTIKMYNNIDIVKMNQERKINSLPFYPFDKNMDNYGTVYIAIYCKKIGNSNIKSSTIADNILKFIVDNLNTSEEKKINYNIKYVPLDPNSNPIYFTIGD